MRYYRKDKFQWVESREYPRYIKRPEIPSIDLTKEEKNFVFVLFDFLFSNQVSMKDAPFTCSIKDEIAGKYLDNDFIFVNEQVNSIIEEWCKDNKEKKEYLLCCFPNNWKIFVIY